MMPSSCILSLLLISFTISVSASTFEYEKQHNWHVITEAEHLKGYRAGLSDGVSSGFLLGINHVRRHGVPARNALPHGHLPGDIAADKDEEVQRVNSSMRHSIASYKAAHICVCYKKGLLKGVEQGFWDAVDYARENKVGRYGKLVTSPNNWDIKRFIYAGEAAE